MKTIKLLLAACLSAALMLSVPIPVLASESSYFSVEGCDCTFQIVNDYVRVKDIAEDAAGPDLVIPSSIDPGKITTASLRNRVLNGEYGEWEGNIPVKRVDLTGYTNFRNNTTVENLILSEGITNFNINAKNAKNLKSVQIPTTLTRVEMQDYMTETDDGYTVDTAILDTIEGEAGDFILFHDFLIGFIPNDAPGVTVTLPEEAKRLNAGYPGLSTASYRVEYTNIASIKGINAKFEEHIFTDNLKEITDQLFELSGIRTDALYIPPSCTKIDPSAFGNVKGLTLLGEKGSAAETFAAAHKMPFYALNETKDGIRWFMLEDGTACIYEVTKPMKNVTLPAEIDGIPVSQIGYNSRIATGNIFKRNDVRNAVESVTVPEGVRQVSPAAFRYLPNAKSFSLPQSLEKCECAAFDHTAWLDAQTDEMLILDGWLLRYTGDYYNPKIPDTVTHIAPRWLQGNITSLSWPAQFKVIETGQLDCPTLDTLKIPDTVTEIQSGAIISDELHELFIPKTVKTIAADSIQQTPESKNRVQRIIFGVQNSAASDFARDADYTFITSAPVGTVSRYKSVLKTPENVFSFANSGYVFGSSYDVSDTHRAMLQKAGADLTQKWGGSCFGMSALVMMMHDGIFDPHMISDQATCLHDLEPSEKLLSIINSYQLLSASDSDTAPFLKSRQSKPLHLLDYASRASADGKIIIIVLHLKTGSHAVVGCGFSEGEWDESPFPYRIPVWDPNKPDAEIGERDIYISADGTEWEMPYYGIGCLKDSETGKYSTTGDILYAINDSSVFDTSYLPDLTGDINGDGVITAADLTYLKRIISGKKIGDRSRADINKDGTIDTNDIQPLVNYLTAKTASMKG
ncbi:MAG TPA: hypothetical protein DCP68_04050 [Ruminococcus sp.]|nr:hypothetical protein [Ruminococcus sp.]